MNTAPIPTTEPIHALPPPDPLAELEALKADLERALKKRVAQEECIEELRVHLAELQSNNFNYTLQNLDAGSVLEELGEEMTALGEKVNRLHAKGSLTLTLALSPTTGRAYTVEGSIKTKPPEQDKPSSIFFIDADGKLTRDDPHQKDLFR